ncbi:MULTISPECIES: sensor histidine kinase [Paenibacillus]|uniref:sensor histidine kinase n=1 Tax=Paenibacillus TaxID=44249 RepID=UPI001E40ED0A|nr:MULTISPECIES: sensor histidine kinase [Paenibacillus]
MDRKVIFGRPDAVRHGAGSTLDNRFGLKRTRPGFLPIRQQYRIRTGAAGLSALPVFEKIIAQEEMKVGARSMKKRLWVKSIYPKIVIGFLLAIVPVYAAALYMNESGSESVEQEITQSLNARTNFFVRTLEQELRTTVLLMNDLSQDSDLQKLSTIAPAMTRYEYFQSINRLQGKMRLLQSSNQYIQEAKAYVPLIDKTIQQVSYETAMPVDQMEVMLRKPDRVIYKWGDKLQLGMVYPDHLRAGKQPNFVIVTELSMPRMQKALEQLATGNGSSVLIGSDGSWSVMPEGAGNIGHRLMENIDVEALSKSEFYKEPYNTKVTVDGSNYWVSVERSSFLNADLVVYVPEAEFLGPLAKYRLLFFGLSGFSLLVVILFSGWIYRRIHQPLHRMVRAFRKMDVSSPQAELRHRHNDEFHYLYEHFNLMVKRLQLLIQEVFEQKIRSQRSELKQLQSQINPHFLYNSFFTLHQMGQMQDYDNIVRFTKHLGDYFRFITRNSADEVPLEAEVGHAKAYVEIQSIRFHNRISAQWDEIPTSWKGLAVPLLILQPLIENAYEHGLEDKEADGRIRIRMDGSEADMLRIIVEDNGEQLTDEKLLELQSITSSPDNKGEITGLSNVHRRLQLKFGSDSGLVFTRSHLGGLKIEMRLPRMRKEQP